jgi:serine/threonine protein kinase
VENEGVPVDTVDHPPAVPLVDRAGLGKVVVAGAVCRELLRCRVKVGQGSYFREAQDVLHEVRALRQLAHDHLLSVYASYLVDDSVNVLLSGVAEYSLKNFLHGHANSFKRLTKPQRRWILLNWPHCLASAIAWLHAHGQSHGSVRPSNILIDSSNHIYLGLFDAFDTLIPSAKTFDMETYHYDVPEHWVRTAAVQQTGPARTSLPSGGRTVRRMSNPPPMSSPSNSRSASTSTTASEPVAHTSPNSSVFIVHKWQDCQSNALPADIFALAAITLDIFTCLCKRRPSTFVHYRGAKNQTPGRGGGVADASFHLDRNMGQVISWSRMLERDASEQKDPVYRGVKPMLVVVREMLSRDPESRPLASQVVSRFASAITQVDSSIGPHCGSMGEAEPLASQAATKFWRGISHGVGVTDPHPGTRVHLGSRWSVVSGPSTDELSVSSGMLPHFNDDAASLSSASSFSFRPIQWDDRSVDGGNVNDQYEPTHRVYRR